MKIAAMREGGAHLGKIRRHLMSRVEPGLDLLEIETEAVKLIRSVGGIPNFAEVNGYGFATCLMVNDEVVHCQPAHRILKTGDAVTIDVGLSWQGWHLDTADSCLVGKPDDRFLSTGRQALKSAIREARPGHRIGHISRAMEKIIVSAGYSPVKRYCGHGVGQKLHEEPQIFCYLDRPVKQTPRIEEEMTLAIEVMLNEGSPDVVISKDGWHARTADGRRSAQFEHTVLVTSNGPEILTI